MNEVELIIVIDEPWQQEAVEAVVHRFEASNPGVRVRVDVRPNGEIRNALYSGESKADLLQLFNGDLADGSRDGLLLDLRTWIESSDIEALFHPSIMQFVRTGGRIAALPLSATMKGVFYNKQWFDKAGVPYPENGWTWNNFLEAALQLQRENVSPGEKRCAARISFHREYIGLLLMTAGTDWTSPDRTQASGYTNSPKSIEAITWAADLVRKHEVAVATQEYFKNDDILGNETGMILDYFVMLHEIQPILKDDLGVVGLPHFWNGNRINELWICGFGISSRTKHPELAWRLLQELTCSSNELTRIVTQGSIAPLTSVYAEVGHDRNPHRNVVLSEMAFGSELPLAAGSDYYNLLDEHVNPALGRIVFEGASVRETLDDLAVRLDRELTKLQRADYGTSC